VSLIIEQEVDILEGGSICLSGKKLGEITAGLSNEPVHLKLDAKSERVEFRAGKFKSKLSGTGAEQFPEIARGEGEWLKIPVAVFYEGLRRTIFAMTEDKSRSALNAVLLLLEDSTLKMVTTDWHRLCFFRIAATAGSGQTLRCLIPGKAARELKRSLQAKSELIKKPKSRSEGEAGWNLKSAIKQWRRGNSPERFRIGKWSFRKFLNPSPKLMPGSSGKR
jgi:DNA polymerase-3 subunit beta